jgi:hypothetical protein
LTEMNERELLNAILYELQAVHAKVDTTADELIHFRKEMYDFKNEMYAFRRETSNNFNKIDRRLRFVETDYHQLNKRVDTLEVSGT